MNETCQRADDRADKPSCQGVVDGARDVEAAGVGEEVVEGAEDMEKAVEGRCSGLNCRKVFFFALSGRGDDKC